jgi:hypothetical protein
MKKARFLSPEALLAIFAAVAPIATPSQAAAPQRIDRHGVVARHNIHWSDIRGQTPLGNGEFCATIDGTGLQTFGGNHMTHWGWHSFPLPEGWTSDRVPATGTFQRGRVTGGDEFPAGAQAIRSWMFDNPHRLNLARIRLRKADGNDLTPANFGPLRRELDLWSGLHTARYEIDGQPVRVETCVHPRLDMVAVRIESALVARGAVEVVLDFPYAALDNAAWVGDFSRPQRHETRMTRDGDRRATLRRKIDGFEYQVGLAWSPGCLLKEPQTAKARKVEIRSARYTGAERQAEILDNREPVAQPGDDPHTYRLAPRGAAAIEFVCCFSEGPPPQELPSFEATVRAAASGWQSFWTNGGAIDLSGSKDSRWRELERRIVLSQYLTAVQSSGRFPPAETGLMGLDPWRGQFHMEMVWWHMAHFALWDRWERAERAMECYRRFVPSARALARQLGYKGLKWPKSVGPEGRSAPWVGNQVLLWKQPHPIFFAELEYRLRPTPATLRKWAEVVTGTAEHMADYPTRDAKTGLYSLSPVMPPSEQGITRDAVFDLAYWRWGLDAAQTWRRRMGLPPEPRWDEVRRHLAPLPVSDGVFVHSAEWSDTYANRAWEHPDPIGVLGMLPPVDGVDGETAHRTALRVWKAWNWKAAWGWDYPWMAMAAARVGEPRMAVEALLCPETHNGYDQRGVNRGGPCPYLPGNGGLLYAVAMMAAGWDGAPNKHAPGFPDDGSWNVRWEGLKKAP